MLLLSAAPAAAQSRVGTAAATFLTLGTGARGSSVGHAYTAAATGADGLFWNPSGIARSAEGSGPRGSLLFSHYQWFEEVDYNALGAVVPIGSAGAVGLSVILLDYGDQEIRTIEFPDGTGETFGANDLSIGATFAQSLTPSFFIGGTAKYVRQRIRDMAASAFAFDLGFALVTDYLNGLTLAASIQNFGTKMQMDGINSELYVDVAPGTNFNSEAVPARIYMDEWSLPLSFKLGLLLPVVRAGNYELDFMAESHQTNDNNLNADLGVIGRYAVRTFTFEVRGGYKDAGLQAVDNHFSYGVGLDLTISRMRFGFDFAYLPFDHLGDTRLVDFRLGF